MACGSADGTHIADAQLAAVRHACRRALPVILCKSTLLALAAGYAASRFGRVSMPLLALVVIFYQSLGSLFEWAWTGSAAAALQDVRIGAWGMALQVVAGWAVIRYLLRK